jgi:radical SAM superfamily enzyme YgiQ (UPF0313 family)
MTDLLFGQSYYLRFDPKLWEAMQPYPPLGTLYAASLMRQRGYQVALFDAMLAESEAEWAAALARHQPRMAVLYEDNFNYLSKMCLLRMRQAAITMIAAARAQGCTVIVAGSDASDNAETYLDAGADVVLVGEGEATLAELVDALTSGQAQLDAVAGIVFRRAGRLVRTARRPDIKQLDELPFPAWDLVDVERYQRIWRERHGYYAMNMVTTRGCPYHCNWCAKPIWGQRYNLRSPENVVAELAWLKRNYAPDFIWFADDILGLRPGWLARFAELAEQEDARVPFKCLSRADLLLREGAVEGLARAGCRIVWIGAESGSQRVLNAMEKGTRVEQIYEAARRLRAAGVQVGFFLQFGYPGETRADIELTLQMVRDCRPDDIGMSVSYPLPGTRFYERVQGELGARRNWQDSDDLAMLYHGPYTTAFYRQLYVVLHKEFRMRSAWHELRRGHMPGPQRLARALFYGLTLPLARWRLDRLEHAPHTQPLAPVAHLDLETAAVPSPQEDDVLERRL